MLFHLQIFLVSRKDVSLSTLVDIVDIFDSRVANALPKSIEQLNKVDSQSISKSLAKQTTLERNVTWIRENGMCLELVRPGKSTIKQAGRGAFAQAFIEKDSIIVPAPLNTIIDRLKLVIYDLEKDVETGELVKNYVPIGQQLLLNYCFGHPQSSLLLCPMTNVVLMNHCSSRIVGEGNCGKNGPNAKIKWASSWDTNTPVWLEKSLDDIEAETKVGNRGLSFDVVATRDIAPGEEIFLDYGIDWENKWNDHIENWEPPEFTSDYKSVRSMINDRKFKTVDELESNPYPDNVLQVCFCKWCDSEDEEDDEESEDEIEEEKITHSGSTIASDVGVEGEESLYPCDIVEKASDESFTVRVFCKKKTFMITSYSSDLVTFRMQKYTSDQHLSGVFRHFIGIDDDMFPDHWKNLHHE